MATISYLQSVTGTGVATGTMTVASTVGDVIIVARFGTDTVTSVTDAFGNTYTQLSYVHGSNTSAGHFVNSQIFYAINATGSTTNTLTYNPTATTTASSVFAQCEYRVPTSYQIGVAGQLQEISLAVASTETKLFQNYASVFTTNVGTTTEIMGVLFDLLQTVTAPAAAASWAVATGNLRQTGTGAALGNWVYADYDVSTNTAVNTLTYTGTGTVITATANWNYNGVYISAIVPTPIGSNTGSFAYVQSTSTVAHTTLTMSHTSSVGDLIIAVAGFYGGSAPTSVVDNLGNTYKNLQYGQTTGTGIIATPNIINGWVATNTTVGTITVTFSGGGTGNNSYIISEYNVPTAWFVEAPSVTMAQVAMATGSLWQNVFNSVSISNYGSATEVMMIPICYDTHNNTTWGLSSGTVRQFTAEGGGESLMLGDYDVMLPSGTATHTITGSSQSNNWFVYPINLVAFGNSGTITSSGGGGGIREQDWSGGMFG